MQHPYLPQPSQPDPLAAAPASDQIAGLNVALVGREAVFQDLIDRFSRLLRHGGVQMLTITGPMGVGKSRLVAELQRFAADLLDPVPFVYLRASQGDSAPDSLLRQLVAALLDRLGCEAEADPLGALERGVELLLGDGGAEAAHFIGHLLGYDLSASPHLRGALGDARQIRARALRYLGLCVQIASTQTPLVLVADHLHAADESSLDALAYLAEEVPGANLLICCLAQPELLERRPDWGGARIELAPLDGPSSRRLVAEILRLAAPLPEGLADLIADQAQGNPLLIHELINTLIADQVVLPGPERWQIRPGWQGRLRSAQTLAGLLEARLLALSPDKQTLLRYAAVLGAVFWADAALDLIPPDLRPADPDALLASLEAQLLIVRQLNPGLPGQRAYRFQQELLRGLAYAQHPPERRAGLHLALAEWLLAHGAAQQPSYASLIAAQYERGGQDEQAGRWYARAASHAHAIFARAMAIDYFGQALRLLPDLPDYAEERLGCALKLAELYGTTNQPAEALEIYDTLHAVASVTVSPTAIAACTPSRCATATWAPRRPCWSSAPSCTSSGSRCRWPWRTPSAPWLWPSSTATICCWRAAWSARAGSRCAWTSPSSRSISAGGCARSARGTATASPPPGVFCWPGSATPRPARSHSRWTASTRP